MRSDSNGLEVLTEDQCFTLAATVPVGRIVFTDKALPAIWPASFVVEDDSIVVCVPRDSKLTNAADCAVVAFETDDFDPITRSGWSATFVGLADRLTDARQAAALAAAGLAPLGPPAPPAYLRLRCVSATGRRLAASRPAPATVQSGVPHGAR